MFFENWGFTEWSTITTISLSVIAIVIAICSSRSTSKAAEKQIREIKQLAALQIDVSIKQLEAEIQKVMVEVKKSAKESMAIDEINKSGLAIIKNTMIL
jgi:predicted secreted acid phosphatase